MSIGKIILAAAVCTLAVCSGCVSTEKKESKTAALDLQRPENMDKTFTSAEKFSNALWNSLVKNDFKIWQAEIPATFTKKITPEMFSVMRSGLIKQFGDFERSSYLGMLDQGLVCDHLWKFRFSRKSTDGKSAAPREIICWVRVYQEKAGEPAVGGFGFKPF